MKCPHCGAPIHENDQICSFCGSELPVVNKVDEAPKEPTPEPEPTPVEPEPANETIIVTPAEPTKEVMDEVKVEEDPLPIDEDDEDLNTALNAFMDDDDDEPEESKLKIILITGAIIIAVILLIFGRHLFPTDSTSSETDDNTPGTEQPVTPEKPEPADDVDEKALQDFVVGFQNEFIKVLNGEDNKINSFLLEGSDAYKYFDKYVANGQTVKLLEFDITSHTKDPQNQNKLIVKTYEKVEVDKPNEAVRQEIINRTIVLMKNNNSWLVESMDKLEPIDEDATAPTKPTKPTTPTKPTAPVVSDGYKASGSFTGGVSVDNQTLKDVRFGVQDGYERLVIDFTGHSAMGSYTATISDDGMTITISLSGNKAVSVDDLTFASSSLIKKVDTYQSSDEKLASITITLNQPSQMKVFDLKEPVRLVIDIMSYGK